MQKKHERTTGHSDKFISFIEKELQPYIETKYKTNNDKTIIGQSLGGLFATEVLLKNRHFSTNTLLLAQVYGGTMVLC